MPCSSLYAALDGASPLGLAQGGRHRVGHLVPVHDHFPVHVAGGPARGLDQRRPRPQIAFLVGVEDGHQRHLGDVEPLAQQVDADQRVELAEAQVADDGGPVEGVDVRVQVAHAQAELLVVLGQVLGHPLGERGHQHPLLALGPGPDLVQEVVHLVAGRPHGDLGVHQAGGPDDLLGQRVAGKLQLVVARRGRHVDRLAGDPRELLEVQRPVVEGRRQPEAVLDQRLLARAVAVVHAAHLRHRHVALVDDDQGVGRQVLDQHRRGLARPPPREVARVVLDAVAVAQLAQHLHVEQRALLQALGLQQPVLARAGRPGARRAPPGPSPAPAPAARPASRSGWPDRCGCPPAAPGPAP